MQRFLNTKQMKIVLVLCFCFCFIFFTHGVHGGRKTLSREEDLELDRQVRLLNKPAIKTIVTEHKDIYDCVDIYKQPAFDHPLLKDHEIQMKPSFVLNKETQKSSVSKGQLEVGLKDGGCPKGTVPIKRTKKEDLIRAKHVVKRYNGKGYVNTVGHFAITRLSGGDVYGAQASIGVYRPDNVTLGHASQAAIWLSSGQPDVVNAIHVGWVVDPVLYNDTLSRTFTYWTADGYVNTGCYNTLCPGFVQTNPSIPLDLPFPYVSNYKGEQFDYKVVVLQDIETQHWWLSVNEDKVAVGYWPREMFPLLNSSAEVVDFGGAAYHPEAGQNVSPPMGSGHFPSEGVGGACLFSQIQVNYIEDIFVNPKESELEQLSDRKDLYDVGGRVDGISEPGYAFLFGGPGGNV